MNDYKSIIDKLDAEKLCRYLINMGWQQLPDLYSGKIKQFQSRNEEEAVLVPMSKSFTDYYREVKETLSIIAQVERKTIEELTNKLLNPSQDILKWRIADELTNRGVIPFNSMTENIEHIKDLLASTILDIIDPSKTHPKLYTKEVNAQLSKYQFGQTEIGSYILNILCPLGYYQYNLFNPELEEMPMGRKVNMRILEGISKVQKSITDRSSELQDILDEGKISVNFLTALTKLYEENNNADVSIKADWNSYVPLPSNIEVSNVALNPRCYDSLMEVVAKNSPQLEQNIEKTYCGKICTIKGDADVANREKITVIVSVIDDDMRKTNVNVELNYQQYFSTVSDAFETGANVIVKGIVSRTAKTIKLSDASIQCV